MGDHTSRQHAPVGAAMWVLLTGGILSLGGLPFPVNGRYWDADDDAERITVIDADRFEFAVAFGVAMVGTVIIGIGLALLARALSEHASSRRRGTAATVATGTGAIGALGGLVALLHAIFATPEFFVDSVAFDVAVVGGGIGLMLAMIIDGVLAWSGPPPRWAVVVLIVGALLGFVPEVQQIAIIVFASAGLITLARRTTSPARSVRNSVIEPSP